MISPEFLKKLRNYRAFKQLTVHRHKIYRLISIVFDRLLIFLSVFPVVVLLFFFVHSFGQGNVGFKVDKTQHGLLISKVDAGINSVREGDLIISISSVSYSRVLGHLIVPDKYVSSSKFTIQRGSQKQTLKINTVPMTLGKLMQLVWPRVTLISFFLSLAFIAKNKASASIQAKLFFVMLCGLSTSVAATTASSLGLMNLYAISTSFLVLTVSNWLSFAAWLHFSLRFPASRDLLYGRRWVQLSLYIIPPLTAIILSFVSITQIGEFWSWLQRYRNIFLPIIILSAFGKHLLDYKRLKNVQSRNQLKLPLAAYWLSFTPYLFFYLLPNLLIDRPLISFRLVILSFFFLPLAYLVGLLRYGLFDVDRIISRGVAFIMVVTSVSILYSAFLTMLKRLFFGNQVLSEEIFLLFFITVVISFYPAVNYLTRVIDKIFFRYTPVPSEVLHKFSNRVSATLSKNNLTKSIVEELPIVLNVESVAILILYEKHSKLYPEHLRIGDSPWSKSKLVEKFGDTSIVYQQTENTGEPESFDSEMTEIRKAGFSLVFPMRTAIGLAGIMLIGKQRNNRYLSQDEILLIASIANQTAIALENARRYESLIASNTQIQELFNQRIQQEKMVIVGEMTSTLAHEIKNPLGIIHSSAQYLITKERSQTEKRELLGYIIDEVEHLNSSIENLLGLARQKPPKFEGVNLEVELPVLIQRWMQSSDHNPGIQIETEIEGSLPLLYADIHQIRQVLTNLIRNSEEMMEADGTIYMTTRCSKDKIIITVIDSGPGIEPQYLDKVFTNFFTTKDDGLGLGLVVSKQIVSAHQGTIELHNHLEGGAEAIVTLPLRPLANTGLPDF